MNENTFIEKDIHIQLKSNWSHIMIQQNNKISLFKNKFRSISVLALVVGFLAVYPSVLLLGNEDLQKSDESSHSQVFAPNCLPKSHAIHSPIFINGNDWSLGYPEVIGSGTLNDPYLIANLTIDAGGSNGIFIENSQVYGFIQNCTVLNGISGIFLRSSSNCTLAGNLLTDNSDHGIFLWLSSNCTLIRNTLSNNPMRGITLGLSPNCILTENLVTNQSTRGIALENSPNCTLTENTATNQIEGGISLWSSSGCSLIENTLDNNSWSGIDFWNSSYCTLTWNNVTNQSLRGIILADSSNCILTENIVTNHIEGGISLFSSFDCTLIGNIASNNLEIGIYLWSSWSCTLSENTANNNGWDGIGVGNSSYCTLTSNTATNNSKYGIILSHSSTGNSVFENWLIRNSLGAILEDTTGNYIYDNIIIDFLIASFAKSEYFVPIGDIIFFTDESTGGVSPFTYFWDFGDGITSTLQNPSHSYNTAGEYTVSLTVTDSDGDISFYSSKIIVSTPTDTPSDESTLFTFDTLINKIPGYSPRVLLLSTSLALFLIWKRKIVEL